MLNMKKLLLCTAGAAAAICLTAVRAQIPANQKLRLAEAAISQFYVDTVNEDALVEAGIKSMLNMLKGYYDLGYFKTKGTSANATYTSSRFTAGEIFMSIGSTGGTTYNSTNDFEVGVVADRKSTRLNSSHTS